jgi:hypothetical protein
MVDWFRRFGDIPGITYEDPPTIDRTRLPGHEAVPEIHVHEFEGIRHKTLSWPIDGGTSSASPAHGRAFGDTRDVPTPVLVKNVHEGLALPGVPSDYHYLIQPCADEFWGRRRQEPDVVDIIEKFCWLDVQLIEARPEAVMNEFAEEPTFYSVSTFRILIELYEHEGFLHEALDIADRAARYGQGFEARDRLAEQIAAVENEDSE